MRVLLLADAASAHTQKWANALRKQDITLGLISLADPSPMEYDESIILYSAGIARSTIDNPISANLKLVFLKALPAIKKAIRQFRPDIVHAHYASSYGLLGALSGFHPLIISVWGTDILSFPNESYMKKILLQFNLSRADNVQATSPFLAEATARFTNKQIAVVPFGVDCDIFCPGTNEQDGKETVTIGMVKGFEDYYGVGYLLQAIQLFRESHPELNFRVKLAGKGSKEQELRNYVLNAGLEKVVTFDGYIPYRALPGYIQKFNVAVYPSLRESFGVSLLEAQACGVPVIASNITPFRDVLIDGKSGLLVPPCSAEKLCEAIVMLMNDRELRRQFGNAGRQFVMENYSLAACVSKQLSVYSQLV